VVSAFEHMTEAEMVEGFARLDAAAVQETTPEPIMARSNVLVLAAN
jgi:hypothetical protein